MEKINTWPGWTVIQKLGSGSFGEVYEICKDEDPSFRAALKIIRIPKDQSELDSVYREGLDKKSVTKYFRSMVDDVTAEFALMEKLKGITNIVSYLDHQIIEHKDSIGWDILIRMELLTPLIQYERNHLLTENDVITLGKDISKALEVCQRYNIIHRDIKPENIFVNEFGDFKLGDFGIARHMEKSRGTMSAKGTYTYMAPEVYRGDRYSANVDVYSLGIMLYRCLNGNRIPFLPTPPNPITYQDRQNALERRLGGEQIPEPIHGSEELKRIVMKAINFDPSQRYQSAAELRKDLEACKIDSTGEAINTINIIDEDQRLAQTTVKEEKTETQFTTLLKEEETQILPSDDSNSSNTKKKSSMPKILIALVALIAIVAAVIGIGLGSGKKNDTKVEQETNTQTNIEDTAKITTQTIEDGNYVNDTYGFSFNINDKILKQNMSITEESYEYEGEQLGRDYRLNINAEIDGRSFPFMRFNFYQSMNYTYNYDDSYVKREHNEVIIYRDDSHVITCQYLQYEYTDNFQIATHMEELESDIWTDIFNLQTDMFLSLADGETTTLGDVAAEQWDKFDYVYCESLSGYFRMSKSFPKNQRDGLKEGKVRIVGDSSSYDLVTLDWEESPSEDDVKVLFEERYDNDGNETDSNRKMVLRTTSDSCFDSQGIIDDKEWVKCVAYVSGINFFNKSGATESFIEEIENGGEFWTGTDKNGYKAIVLPGRDKKQYFTNNYISVENGSSRDRILELTNYILDADDSAEITTYSLIEDGKTYMVTQFFPYQTGQVTVNIWSEEKETSDQYSLQIYMNGKANIKSKYVDRDSGVTINVPEAWPESYIFSKYGEVTLPMEKDGRHYGISLMHFHKEDYNSEKDAKNASSVYWKDANGYHALIFDTLEGVTTVLDQYESQAICTSQEAATLTGEYEKISLMLPNGKIYLLKDIYQSEVEAGRAN